MADPYYANVSLLLPMNGANNGTVFTDYSPTTKTITRYGDTNTVTSASKYYGSSGYFDGAGDYLGIGDSADFAFGGGDFTIEGYISQDTNALLYPCIISQRTTYTSNFAFLLFINSNTLFFDCRHGATVYGLTFSGQFLSPFRHFALVRSGNNYLSFSDGVLGPTVACSGSMTDSTAQVKVGASDATPAASSYFKGRMQDLRVTKGVARYTADFTPPARLLPGVSGTILDTTGTPCARQVYVYNQATGALLAATTSDASTGYYEAFVHPAAEEVFRVVVANEATLYNNLIDRVFPG